MNFVLSDNERELDLINDANIRLLQDGLDMPLVGRELTYAESADSDGRRRIRSKNQNAEGKVTVSIRSTTAADFWDNVDDLIELVESAHRNKGTIRYQPPDGTEMTLDIESITVTGLPQRGIELRSERIEVEVTFEVQPYGRLAEKRIGGYLTQAEVLDPSMLLALDSTNGATDLSGNGRDGTGVGGINIGGFATSPLVADPDGSTDFDNSDDRITTTYSTRRNYFPNPSGETGTTGWNGYIGSTLSQYTADSYVGAACLRSEKSSAACGIQSGTQINGGGAFESETLTASVWIKAGPNYDGTTQLRFLLREYESDGSTIVGTTTVVIGAVPDEWTQIEVTRDFSATGERAYIFLIDIGTFGGQMDVLMDGWLLEIADSAGTYFDGSGYIDDSGGWVSDSGGHTGWTGTAHESASDKGCFANGTTRTFTGWARRNTDAGADAVFGSVSSGDTPLLHLGSGSTDVLFFPSDGGSGTTWTAAWPGLNQWVHWALVFDEAADTASLYIDGALDETKTGLTTQYPGPLGGLQIGRRSLTSAYNFDGQMAGFAVYERGLTADEIARLYEAAVAEWQLDGPIDYVTVVDVPGQVMAFGDLELTDASTQDRQFVEVGVQNSFDVTNPEPLLLTAGTMADSGGTLTGLSASAGTVSRPAGAYTTSSGDSNTLRAVVAASPAAIATTSARPHKGLWKVRARVQSDASDTLVRLAWRVGDGPFAKEAWRSVPNASTWYDLDLGTLNIPEMAGTHSWEGRIEVQAATGFITIDLDTVCFIPCDSYTRLRGSSTPDTNTFALTASDSFSTLSGTLSGGTVEYTPSGTVTWSTSGATGDFTVDTTNEWLVRNQGGDASLEAGRFARVGNLTAAACVVSSKINFRLATTYTSGVFARYVDGSNYLVAELVRDSGGFGSVNQVVLLKNIAGSLTTLGSAGNAFLQIFGSGWNTLSVQVDSAGKAVVQINGNTVISVSDSDLATGNTLASGGFGIYHANTGTANANDAFDDFQVTSLNSATLVNPVIHSSRAVDLTHEAALSESSDGSRDNPTPIVEGNYLRIPPATRNETKQRIVVRSRRQDVQAGFADNGLTDDLTASLSVTPRVTLK